MGEEVKIIELQRKRKVADNVAESEEAEVEPIEVSEMVAAEVAMMDDFSMSNNVVVVHHEEPDGGELAAAELSTMDDFNKSNNMVVVRHDEPDRKVVSISTPYKKQKIQQDDVSELSPTSDKLAKSTAIIFSSLAKNVMEGAATMYGQYLQSLQNETRNTICTTIQVR